MASNHTEELRTYGHPRGHRVGDIRRYLKLYGMDFFPFGPREDPTYPDYGTAQCYIPHLDERVMHLEILWRGLTVARRLNGASGRPVR